MSLVRYEPWGMLEQMRKEMDRMMGEENAATASDWVPAVDIREDKESFTITADLPGVNAKDIEVHAENGMLTIRGERDSEKKESAKATSASSAPTAASSAASPCPTPPTPTRFPPRPTTAY